MSLIRAQVVYHQGLIVEVVADGEMSMSDFMTRIEATGKVRTIRGVRDATPADVAGWRSGAAVHVDDLPKR